MDKPCVYKKISSSGVVLLLLYIYIYIYDILLIKKNSIILL